MDSPTVTMEESFETISPPSKPSPKKEGFFLTFIKL